MTTPSMSRTLALVLATLLALPLVACSDDSGSDGGAADASDDRRRRPLDANGSPDGTASDSSGGDGVCIPDCAGRVCGLDPNCGTQCGVPCTGGLSCVDGACVESVDAGNDATEDLGTSGGELSEACATFCDELCDFLFDCGKDDPECVSRCGASPRFQALSDQACNEGAQVIGLESCPLWLDCGGQACAIDEMCLEVIAGLSYRCAPICDHTQDEPACAGTATCQNVADANGRFMSALGMCFSLF